MPYRYPPKPESTAAFDPDQVEDTRTKASRYFDPRREPFSGRRRGWGAQPMFAILQCEQVHTDRKTRAPSPCWRDSTTKPVKWRVVIKDECAELIRKLEDFERQTRQPGRQDGAIGRNGLAVFRALIFGFLDYANGRLDPGYAAIARRACISVRSVARGLVRLKLAGVLDRVRRCTPRIEAGRCVLDQETNAYGTGLGTYPCEASAGLHHRDRAHEERLIGHGADPGTDVAVALGILKRT